MATKLSAEATRPQSGTSAARGPSVRRAAGSLVDRLMEPVDISSLVCFRMAFGGLMLWEVVRYFQHGWLDYYYIEPIFHFTYYGFGWVRPWPPFFLHLHFYVMGACALFILLGLCYRAAAALFFLAFTYIFLIDQARYLNHFYLISLVSLLMVFIPAHRAFSMDALGGRVRSSRTAPAWTIGILRFQIGVVYLFGGIAKLYGDWLIRSEPMRTWFSFRGNYPWIGPYVHEEWLVDLFSYGGLAFDLAVVPLLLWRRTRFAAFLLAVVFNLLNAWLFRIGIFPWFMIAATLLFFSPSWPRRFGFGRLLPAESTSAEERPGPSLTQRRIIASVLAVYCTAQLLVPLRPFLYPGNCRWTEEGRRFSWYMKNRDKYGWSEFKVFDPEGTNLWLIQPEEYLTEMQARKMTIRPDMILQFSHYLAGKFRRQGYDQVQVRADVWVVLNGRPEQRLIDPEVDLAAVRRDLWPAPWILPLEE